jgi:hypothetical protein
MIDIKLIWENQKSTDEYIVRTKINEIKTVNCYAAKNKITEEFLFIISVSEHAIIPDLNNYRFKSVEIYTLPNQNNSIELYIYLLDSELQDIFILLIQNILEELQICSSENEAIITTLNIVSKWKKLFDKINFTGMTLEQQKGLIGELFFLQFLLKNHNTTKSIINFWTSTEHEFQAKDFTIANTGVEIKFSSSYHPKIKVSNEIQLDSENFKNLYLVLYSCQSVKENGISLNTLINDIRENLINNEDIIAFNTKLNLYGYFDEDKLNYEKMYSIKKILAYRINDNFPKITKTNLPKGIFNTTYNIEISSIEKHVVEINDIITYL